MLPESGVTMKHSHLFIAILIGNLVIGGLVLGHTFEQVYYGTSGSGIALLLHWLFNR